MQRFRDWLALLIKPNSRKIFVVLLLSTALTFSLAGALAMSQAKTSMRSSSLGKVTSHLHERTLLLIMSRVIPYLQEESKVVDSDSLFSRLFFETVASMNPQDPRTFLGRELPLFTLFDAEIDLASTGTDLTSIPIESPPPPELEQEIIRGLNQIDRERQQEKLVDGPEMKKVLIYHTHFWESYLPELKEKNPNKASSLHTNIMKVGWHMANTLNKMGVGAVTIDQTPKTGWHGAYKHSRDLAVSMMKQHKEITYLIDLHRDSRRRLQTTKEINGTIYAQLAFVVGEASQNFEKNLQLAREVHHRINQLYPGLSRGVIIKKRANGNNGEYNQSLSPNSMLVEVGGVDNTFEEAFRSVEALAEVLTERINQATPVTK